MPRRTPILLIVALIAGLLDFGGAASTGIAKEPFAIFPARFLASLIAGVIRGA
jgi:uncharacterized membrane protein YtjA (UPF0391 family)